MFERFTDKARRVVVLSQEEARRLHHGYIGTEHILLGLLGEPQGVAGRVLDQFGLTPDGVRDEVITMIGEGEHEAPQRIPFTPRAKKVLELGLREALLLNHNYIGTEHILLGLIREGDGVAVQILAKHGDLPAIRAAVLAIVPAYGGGSRSAALARMLSGGTDPAESGGKLHVAATPATDATVAEAARLAGSQPVGSHHLLLAALTDSTSAAAKALASAGIDLDQAAEALRNVDIEGTSDEQPEQAGRRQMNIQVTDELVTIVATDPAIVEAGRTALLALGTHGEGAETPPPGGVIRGADLQGTAATSLATAWQSLMDTLVQVTHAAGQPDNPDQPETEAS